MENLISTANEGLKTNFDVTQVKFKKTFLDAKKLGIDLNSTTNYIKRDGFVWKVSFISGNYTGNHSSKGRYFESIQLIPWLKLKK
jgi:hypothetical protein